MAGPLGETPREAVAALVDAHGAVWVIDRCLEVLTKREIDGEFLVGLSGRHAQGVLQGREGGAEGYWPRVWALRALLYAWEQRASPAVTASLNDESWRVREMALKVMHRHHVPVTRARRAILARDPVTRVRDALERLTPLGGTEH